MSQEPNNSNQSVEISRQRSEVQSKKSRSYVPGQKLGVWSQQEHLKYVVFIDYNKQKMRSKQKRSSNKFYEEMGQFISTRNALQCRSHHQKLQEKYFQISKIINLYKSTFDRKVYREAMDQLDALTLQKKSQCSQKLQKVSNLKVNAQTQTDIQDIQCEFIQVEPNVIVIQKKSPHLQNPQIYQLPSMYQPNPYPRYEYPGHTTICPPLPQSHFSWWGGISPNGL